MVSRSGWLGLCLTLAARAGCRPAARQLEITWVIPAEIGRVELASVPAAP